MIAAMPHDPIGAVLPAASFRNGIKHFGGVGNAVNMPLEKRITLLASQVPANGRVGLYFELQYDFDFAGEKSSAPSAIR